MSRLERGQDAFLAPEPLERRQRVAVVDPCLLGAPALAQPRVLRTDGRVVESGRDRVRQLHVAVDVLEHVTARALQHASTATCKARGVVARGDAAAAGLDADQPDAGVVHERVEDAHGVTAAADARDDRGWQRAELLEALRARLAPD